MYSSIYIDSTEFSLYRTVSDEKEISNLSNINIFIGPNNTGKSKFLRTLFSSNKLKFQDETCDLNNCNLAIISLKESIDNFFNINQIRGVDSLYFGILKPIQFLGNDNLPIIEELLNFILKLTTYSVNTIQGSHRVESLNDYLRHESKIAMKKLAPLVNYTKQQPLIKKIYVPTLRGLRGIDFDDNSKYKGEDSYTYRTKLDYFNEIDEVEENIYSGLNFYSELKRYLLGNSKQRESIKKFQEFLEENFFHEEVTLTPRIDDNVIHIQIGNGDEFPIHQLGDGIQSIIILTFPIFLHSNNNLIVFYEEPDLFLHPGFQRIFLETLVKSKFQNCQFFFTTHSNHFLDMTLDFSNISVYSFHKREDKFEIENTKNDNTNLLQILGVRNSSVFLSNCTIWVEGISDRIYLRKFLSLYCKEKSISIQEDTNYSFVEYGGGNITHWSFLDSDDNDHQNINVEKLCGQLFLITDNDNSGNKKNGEPTKKYVRQQKLKEKLGNNYYCLECREIENILSEQTLSEVIKKFEPENLEINFSKLDRKKYFDRKLGSFIDDNLIGINRTYSIDNQLKEKVQFAKFAVASISNFSQLTEEAKILAERVCNFILNNNK